MQTRWLKATMVTLMSMCGFTLALFLLITPSRSTYGACASCQAASRQSRPEKAAAASATQYYYRFENPQFEVVRMELSFDSAGRGMFSFLQREAEEPMNVAVELLPTTIEQINSFLESLRFLESDETYQGERDASYLGTVTIAVHRATMERQVSFNFTRNEKMRQLASLLRGISTQEYRVFTIGLARRHSRLDLDKRLSALESELKNAWLGEPEKLLPLLREIQKDEDLLLMVRRRAARLIEFIEKESRRAGINKRK